MKCNYQKTLSLFQKAGTFSLPDLSDVTLPEGHCSCMTPQGICVTARYILVTAYCNVKRFKTELKKEIERNGRKQEKGSVKKSFFFSGSRSDLPDPNQQIYQKVQNEPVHHSCLMVFSREGLKHIADLELPDANHVGGIAYDGRWIWIAKSTERCLSIIREEDLEKVLHDHGKGIGYFKKSVPCGMVASFLTYFSGRLWVGYCAAPGKNGILRSFRIQKYYNGQNQAIDLQSGCFFEIPANANGASFYGYSEGTENREKSIFLFVDISRGRKKPSAIYVYRVLGMDLEHPFLKKQNRFTCLPPLLEESCIDEGIFYTVYESSSPSYRDIKGNCCPFPVDVVNMTKAADLVVRGKRPFAP